MTVADVKPGYRVQTLSGYEFTVGWVINTEVGDLAVSDEHSKPVEDNGVLVGHLVSTLKVLD